MSMDLNKVMLIGNLTADPQLRTTQGGQNIASFSVATNRRWKNPSTGEIQTEAQFHNVIAWGKLGDICGQYMKKGMKVFVEGRIQNRSWDDPQTGQKRYRTEIVAESAFMLDSKRDSNGQQVQSVGGYNSFQSAGAQAGQNNFGSTASNKSEIDQSINIPAPEQIPTIDIDEDKDEIKVEDIPF